MGKLLEGKIASVLGPREGVVVNLGTEDGVQQGDSFLLYRLGEEVIDPDSKVSLGRLEVILGRAVVKHVQPKLATLGPQIRKRILHPSEFLPPQVVEEPEDFDESIRIGDLARLRR